MSSLVAASKANDNLDIDDIGLTRTSDMAPNGSKKAVKNKCLEEFLDTGLLQPNLSK